MSRVTVYSTPTCPYCTAAKSMLDKWGVAFTEIHINDSEAAMLDFIETTRNAATVPQILIDGEVIGGYTELTELHRDGELDELIASASRSEL